MTDAVAHETSRDVYARRERMPEEVAVRAAVRIAGRDAVEESHAATMPADVVIEAAADAAGDVVQRIMVREGWPYDSDPASALVRIPPERQGWRARLANVERLLQEHVAVLMEARIDPNGEACTSWRRAVAEVRALIDFDRPLSDEPLLHGERDPHAPLGSWVCHAPEGEGGLGRCATLNFPGRTTCERCGTPRRVLA